MFKKNQSLHFFQYKPYSFGPKLIKNNTIHAQAMTMRKQYWILNQLTLPEHSSLRPSPWWEICPTPKLHILVQNCLFKNQSLTIWTTISTWNLVDRPHNVWSFWWGMLRPFFRHINKVFNTILANLASKRKTWQSSRTRNRQSRYASIFEWVCLFYAKLA